MEDELLVALSLREALSEAGFDVDCAYLAGTVIDDRRLTPGGELAKPDLSNWLRTPHVSNRALEVVRAYAYAGARA